MDITTQVSNSFATIEHTRRAKPSLKTQNCNIAQHSQALQALSNGQPVSYGSTLRVVSHKSRFPPQEPMQAHRSPGYIRNESGSPFSS
ncbi:hypothetical protein WJX72_012274 [[Myrmecia] bisecta]|uniref:Uncharacterized protein n=1 Tax=[Myrmecia] bisecta TaxID=41462 RepID=A0AAW1PQI3_9CHLO